MSSGHTPPTPDEAKRLFAQFAGEIAKLKEQDRQNIHQGIERGNNVMAVANACQKSLNDLEAPFDLSQKLINEVSGLSETTKTIVHKVFEDQVACANLRKEVAENIAIFRTAMRTLEREHEHGARMMEFAERVETQFSVLEEHSSQHAAVLETIKATLNQNKSKLQDLTEEIEMLSRNDSSEKQNLANIEREYATTKAAVDAAIAEEHEVRNTVNETLMKTKKLQNEIKEISETIAHRKADIQRLNVEGEAARQKAHEEHLAVTARARSEIQEIEENTQKLNEELANLIAAKDAKLANIAKKQTELADRQKEHDTRKAELENATLLYNKEFGNAKIVGNVAGNNTAAIDFSHIAAGAVCSTPVTYRLEESVILGFDNFGAHRPRF